MAVVQPDLGFQGSYRIGLAGLVLIPFRYRGLIEDFGLTGGLGMPGSRAGDQPFQQTKCRRIEVSMFRMRLIPQFVGQVSLGRLPAPIADGDMRSFASPVARIVSRACTLFFSAAFFSSASVRFAFLWTEAPPPWTTPI